jgi:hypothetical protein
MTTALEAIQRLIDHAGETYPHFESPRGERDIAEAREALRRLAGVTLAAIVVDARSHRGFLDGALLDLARTVADLDSMSTEQAAGAVPGSLLDTRA